MNEIYENVKCNNIFLRLKCVVDEEVFYFWDLSWWVHDLQLFSLNIEHSIILQRAIKYVRYIASTTYNIMEKKNKFKIWVKISECGIYMLLSVYDRMIVE